MCALCVHMCVVCVRGVCMCMSLCVSLFMVMYVFVCFESICEVFVYVWCVMCFVCV